MTSEPFALPPDETEWPDAMALEPIADLAVEDAAALERLLRCACGAPAMAFAPGTEPLRQLDIWPPGERDPARAWCGACWPLLRRRAA